jgi:hypothetical protein
VRRLTLGKHQRQPQLNVSIDEASALHLTYIWSELRLLGRDPRLWFATMHQDRSRQSAEEPRHRPDRRTGGRRRRAAGPAGDGRGAAAEEEPIGEAATKCGLRASTSAGAPAT